MLAGPFEIWCLAFENLRHNCRGEATMRLAQIAAHHVDHAIGEGDVFLRVFNIGAAQTLGHHHKGHIPDHFGGWRHFDNVAEHLVHIRIHLRHFVPAFFKAHGARLCLEIGELATWHFVQIDLGCRGL